MYPFRRSGIFQLLRGVRVQRAFCSQFALPRGNERGALLAGRRGPRPGLAVETEICGVVAGAGRTLALARARGAALRARSGGLEFNDRQVLLTGEGAHS